MRSGIDIKRQINVHVMLKEMYVIEKEYILKKMLVGPAGFKPQNYEGMPHGSGAQTVSMDRSVESLRKIQDSIDTEQWAIDMLTTKVKDIDIMIKTLTGIDANVVMLRDFEGLPLQLIADKLKYSLDYIKEVSCRNPRKPTINPLTSTILCDIMSL